MRGADHFFVIYTLFMDSWTQCWRETFFMEKFDGIQQLFLGFAGLFMGLEYLDLWPIDCCLWLKPQWACFGRRGLIYGFHIYDLTDKKQKKPIYDLGDFCVDCVGCRSLSATFSNFRCLQCYRIEWRRGFQLFLVVEFLFLFLN